MVNPDEAASAPQSSSNAPQAQAQLAQQHITVTNRQLNITPFVVDLVSHAAVICLVTQRSSPQTAAETWSAFLLNGKTGRSGGTTNGTVLPTGNVLEKKEYLQT